MSALRSVQNEIGSEQAEVVKLIALTSVASLRKLIHKSTQAASWIQNGNALPSLSIETLSTLLSKESLHLFNDRTVTLLPLIQSLLRPFAH
jgi:hypothetical protein